MAKTISPASKLDTSANERLLRCDLGEFLAVLDINLPVGNHLGGANIDIVTAALEMLDEEMASVRTVVPFEASLLQAFENLRVRVFLQAGHFALLSLEQLWWHTP